MATDPESRNQSGPIEIFVRGLLEEEKNNPQITEFHLHEYCAGIFRDEWYAAEAAGHELKIVPQKWIRMIGRRWPLTIIVITGIVIVGAEFSPSIDSLSNLFKALSTVQLLVGAGGIGLWLILLLLFEYGHIIDRRDIVKPAIVYSLLGVLSIGTLFTIFLVYRADDPTNLVDNVVFVSGYLLAIAIGGILSYDTMMRTENLLWYLGKTDLIDNEAGYNEFRSKLKTHLEQSLLNLPITVSSIFGILFVSQFAVFWLVAGGPQGMGSLLLTVVNISIDTLLMIGVYQFAIILSDFSPFLEGGYQSKHGRVQLQYRPFHPDGRGGFRDLGWAAMRVNGILVLGGLYFVYRLFVQGVRTLPNNLYELSITTDTVFWFFNFIFPVILYFILAGSWLYFTFWGLHRQMTIQREEMMIQLQQEQRKASSDDSTLPYGLLNDEESWRRLKDAPVWPIDNRQLTTIVIVNFVPLLLTLFSFLM